MNWQHLGWGMSHESHCQTGCGEHGWTWLSRRRVRSWLRRPAHSACTHRPWDRFLSGACDACRGCAGRPAACSLRHYSRTGKVEWYAVCASMGFLPKLYPSLLCSMGVTPTHACIGTEHAWHKTCTAPDGDCCSSSHTVCSLVES